MIVDEGVSTLLSQIAALDALTDPTTGAMKAPTIHLFQNDIWPSPGMTLADFEEADFTGYTAFEAAVWGTVYVGTDGKARCTLESHQFQGTGTTVGNVIFGWYLSDEPPTKVHLAGRFEEAISMVSATDAVVCEPTIVYGQ